MSTTPDQSGTQRERTAFFRQSGWMVIATTLGGALMYAVHIFAGYIDPEYPVFGTLLQVLNLMLIPSIGLQTVFTQQTAAALSNEDKRKLSAAIRGVALITFVIWLIVASVALVFQRQIVATLKITNPAALWATLVCGLAMLWVPLVQGVLQGRQNFLWLGWVAILNGAGRVLSVGIIILVFHGKAAGAMTGALIGMWVAVLVGAWQSRSAWSVPPSRFDAARWVQLVVPLTLGLGTGYFMLAADMLVVQSLFDQDKTPYTVAGTLARGLVIFTSPLAGVMFPKIVRSAATSEKSSVLGQALGATALLAGGVALFCSLFPELPIKLVYRKPAFLAATQYLPLFIWCMMPLTLTNVLLSNLLARKQFRIVPWLLVISAAYATALVTFSTSFFSVIKTLGAFNLILLAVSCAFTFLGKSSNKPIRTN